MDHHEDESRGGSVTPRKQDDEVRLMFLFLPVLAF